MPFMISLCSTIVSYDRDMTTGTICPGMAGEQLRELSQLGATKTGDFFTGHQWRFESPVENQIWRFVMENQRKSTIEMDV